MITAFRQTKTIHALGRSATVIVKISNTDEVITA
jgi:hypothetical protein